MGLVTAGFAVLLVALAAGWVFGPLDRLLDPAALAAQGDRIRDSPFAPLAVVGLYIVFGFVAAPATLMVGATALTFGAWPGSLYSFAGMLANGIVTYTIARFAARGAVEAWIARHGRSRLDAVNRLLARRGFVAVLLMRLTPFPYTLQNALAGAARVGVASFVGGTAIGVLPVIVVVAGIASRWEAWVADPQWPQLAVLIGVALAAVATVALLRRRAVHRRTQHGVASPRGPDRDAR